MTGDHITESILEACERGEISSEVLLRRILRHLQSQCEPCHQEIARWRRGRLRRSSPGLLAAIAEEGVPPIDDEKEASKDFRTLLPLAVSEQERKINRALSRFRSPLLARELAQEAIGELAHDLKEASHLVSLALLVLSYGQVTAFHREVKAHALAVKAMTLKLSGDIPQASQLFQEARQLEPRHGVVDLVLAGELDEMEGEFLKDRRQLARAEELLTKALVRYSIVGDPVRQARAYLVLSATRFHRERFVEAIRDSKRVLEIASDHKAYSVLAAHNIALFLSESGEPEEAARRLKEYQHRYEDAKGVWRTYDLHFHWLAGKISLGLGHYEQAEVHLTKAHSGFVDRGTTYDTILVSLDLALVYDATQNYADLMRISERISSELSRQTLHKESVAAIMLFVKAATRKVVSEDLVRKISHFLQFSRTDPTLKCEISLGSASG